MEYFKQGIRYFSKIFNRRPIHHVPIRNAQKDKRPHLPKLSKEFYDIIDWYKNAETHQIAVTPIIKVLKESGLYSREDPRLKPFFKKIYQDGLDMDSHYYEDKQPFTGSKFMDYEEFLTSIESGFRSVNKALRSELVIPNWKKFTDSIGRIYEDGKKFDYGQVATYIPQLARSDPRNWAVSICTIDGQRESFGDFKVPFCLQSVSKPFIYAIAIEQLGAEYVHSFVGQEPSGRLFNEICLNKCQKPHNPMINAGAIVVTSLLYQEKPYLSDRYEKLLYDVDRFTGGGKVHFNNAVFLSERESADRNYALAYFMREKKCFPDKTNIREALDLYFQLCSIETTTESLAVMASTLANGGICPMNNERVVCTAAVRDCLSLMLSCGMYDASGQHAFKVGLPAKSGVSGAMMIVVPNVMGIGLYSPRLDMLGNPVRGVKFAEKLVEDFKFHQYDSLVSSDCDKIDPRIDKPAHAYSADLFYATKNNDIPEIKRLLLCGANLEVADYSSRTVLHIAATEGNLEALDFVLSRWKADPEPRDCFGRTPQDDSMLFGYDKCARRLRMAAENYLKKKPL